MKRYRIPLSQTRFFRSQPHLLRLLVGVPLVCLFAAIGWVVYRDGEQTRLDEALLRAVEAQDSETVNSLLQDGANANAADVADDNRSLDDKMLDWLFPRKHHAHLTARPLPALLLSVETRRVDEESALSPRGEPVDVVSALLQHGAAPDVRDAEGSTPLHYAVRAGYGGCARALLAHHANPDAADQTQSTPLMKSLGKPPMVALLLDSGADANRANGKGLTPLHLTALLADDAASTAVARLLLQHGAKVEIADAHGDTPLHAAADNDKPLLTRLLLHAGADPKHKDSTGKTPLAVARQPDALAASQPARHAETIALLTRVSPP